jgi:polyhydroxyalkanoate synthesis repressor PhaR
MIGQYTSNIAFLEAILPENLKPMPLIKRYPNRKLYDTEAKQYVTLEQIAEMIRAGHDVQVTDHETGEDLTTLTLSQVILDQEKKQAGFLPRSLMTNLIRTGGETFDSLLRTLLGSLPMSASVFEERIAKLVATGTLSAEQARSVLKALQSGSDSPVVDEHVTQLLHRFNIPTGRDLEELHAKLAALNAQLDELTAISSTTDEGTSLPSTGEPRS